ncbi:MAG: hypothetical protein CL946_08750 [Ectothiorhodospiraceae bacterium]|nr:hypothetical protein [Ectothiorhodospiraceae bacterium]
MTIAPLQYHAEIVHYAGEDGIITSHGRHVRIDYRGDTYQVPLPMPAALRLALLFRATRRLTRTEKCNVIPIRKRGGWEAVAIIHQGKVYRYELSTQSLTHTHTLRQSRNPLHQSVCICGDGSILFGEYGQNPERRSVPVYRSTDGAESWKTIHEFEAGDIRHVHGCYWDPYEETVWTCTGDLKDECRILVTDPAFEEIELLGDGSQQWRTCRLFFTEEAVYWGTDSEYSVNHVCKLDRRTRTMEKVFQLPGPVIYTKHLADGWMVLSTVVEKGPGVQDSHAHLFASPDGTDWREIYSAEKDAWPMPLFKNGVIAFSDGEQTMEEFYIHAEGLKGIDGQSYRCSAEKW